ncbi:MAG: NAD-dependent epimerase/dehydratase family protein [Bacteroidia bacterium]|nr:NAD-dependent epimerase/dehydratase family protein [Bacteroidia bacterium]MDW8134155.1 NAD-dependent epimerase/dehydratase family protein [Bacteroidia bacterium]
MPLCLVTGGAGFIGSHVADSLLGLGHEVVILDDLSGGNMSNVPSAATFVQGSINDYALLSELFEKYRFDYVFHLAAYAAEGLSHFIRRFNYENNLIGSINLINLSVIHKIKCFVFTSSIAVYGKNQLPMHEDLVPNPEDPYGIAKYAVELDLRSAHELFGLNYIIFRPHNVYGERQNIGDRYRNVVGIFMNQLLQGKPLTIFGDGSQTRAFSYIGDVAPYIAKSVHIPEAYNKVFNIGGDIPYSVRELAEAVMEAMGIYQPIRYLPPRNEVLHAYASHSRVYEVFGIKPEHLTPLSVGLKKMSEWVKKVGARKTPAFQNIEIYDNLPSVWLEE